MDYKKNIIAPIAVEILKKELNSDRFVRKTRKGDNEIYCVNHHNSPNTVLEIGRLREVTFRASGGGTGEEMDLDEYDTNEICYDQLIVWSPEDYVKLKEDNSKNYIEKSIDGSHTDLAKVLYSEFGNHFVCASIESKNWFKFNGNVWEHIESGVDLRRKISDELPNRYQEVYSSFFKSLMEAEKNGNKGEAAMWEKRIKLVSGLIKNLGSTPFKNNVMREATDEFYDSRFKEKLDLNPYIIAFKNGVYDLNNNVFRKGRPEDFLSKTLGVDYREYDLKDDDIIEVMQFIERIFPDPSLMKYFLDMASDVFVGGNHQKKVYFWLGEGDNGKSMLFKMA